MKTIFRLLISTFFIKINIILIVNSILLILISCSDDVGTDPSEISPDIPSPTETTGPGGPAYLAGDIKDYIHRLNVVANTHIYVMDQQDYSDTLAHVFVTSSNASFKITELPVLRVDLIFMNDNYLCAKVGKLSLRKDKNSFYNSNSDGFFIDSTVFITNISDSVGRPDAPLFGIQGYDSGLAVYLKLETADSLGWKIIQLLGCDTLRVDKYDDPVFDPFENDVYLLKCKNIKSVSESLIYLNWHKEILRAGQIFQVIQQ